MRFSEILESAVGTYVAANFSEDSVKALTKLQEEIGVPNPVSPEDFHTTIVYSRIPIEWETMDHDVPAKVVGYRVFETGEDHTKCLVLEIDCPSLTERFEESMEKGASFDFPSYIPHITLSYDIGDFSIDDLDPPKLEIIVTSEFKDELR